MDNLPALQYSVFAPEIKSNIGEYKAKAVELIESINMELNLDADFVQAKQDIKTCQALEAAAKKAKEEITQRCEDLYAVFSDLDYIAKRASGTRLPLTKLSKTRQDEIKALTLRGYQDKAKSLVGDLSATMQYQFDYPAFNPGERLGGLKTIDSYVARLEETLAEYRTELSDFIHLMSVRSKQFHAASDGYSYLFPDAAKLIQSLDMDMIKTVVQGRILEAKHSKPEPVAAPVITETVEVVNEDTGEVAEIERPVEMVTITQVEHIKLLKSLALLRALNHFGVKNWEYYGDAVEMARLSVDG